MIVMKEYDGYKNCEYNEYASERDTELEDMFADAAWDLNNEAMSDDSDAKVLRMEGPSREVWESMGEHAIAANMDAVRDDYGDKGLSDMEIDEAVAADYDAAREEFYTDLNEGQALE